MPKSPYASNASKSAGKAADTPIATSSPVGPNESSASGESGAVGTKLTYKPMAWYAEDGKLAALCAKADTLLQQNNGGGVL